LALASGVTIPCGEGCPGPCDDAATAMSRITNGAKIRSIFVVLPEMAFIFFMADLSGKAVK
jgi:hypothetical protein